MCPASYHEQISSNTETNIIKLRINQKWLDCYNFILYNQLNQLLYFCLLYKTDANNHNYYDWLKSVGENDS